MVDLRFACHPEPHRRRGTSQSIPDHSNQKAALFDTMIARIA